MVGRVAAGIAADGDAIACLERVLFNSLTAQLAGGAPFRSPRDGLVLLTRSFQKNGGVWIAVEELDDRALESDCFGRISSRERVVCLSVARAKERRSNQNCQEHDLS